MEKKLVAGKPDQTVFEGEGGGYYAWSAPLLSDFRLGAGKLLLHPQGFAFPHYSDSSKICYVLQGSFTVGLVPPNTSQEQVVLIKKGDALPLPSGVVSWWFNGGDTDAAAIFLGQTTKAQVPGQFAYFVLGGVLGVLAGFQPDFVARTFNLPHQAAERLVNSQPGALIIRLGDRVEFPNATEKLSVGLDTPPAATVVEGGGVVGSVTEREFPSLGGVGLSPRFVRLEGGAMAAPGYVADGEVQAVYVAKGAGRVRVVGSEGKAVVDRRVEEGDLVIVPGFFVVAHIAEDHGMELFSVVTSSRPIFGQLVGKLSVWKALSSIVLQSTLNIDQEFEEFFKLKNSNNITIIPPNP